ncbi:MAG: Cys-tRNA(Pro) deacylase [Desulfobulbus propionicus]|nr:MAG: Cys-tRNA(Pro) deacylase [Desulfobulbus propionicus]
MTPAIHTAKKAGITFTLHEYGHSRQAPSYGEEAAKKLDVIPDRVFKTLVVADENTKLYVAVVPVTSQLNLKLLARAAGVKKMTMADKKLVEKTTGYVLGGVSPLGQKKALPTFVHATAQHLSTIFVSAGKRGLELELVPDDLLRITSGRYQTLCA